MTSIDEIANNIFRISTYFADFNLQFNQFLIRDDEPLLFETGMKGMFPLVREAVSKIIDPASLRYVAFSHFEPDECGSLNDWLALAPRAEALTSIVGAMVFVNDGAVRPARGLNNDEIVKTGSHSFRFKATPHLPHGWDAGFLFEETTKTLLCSDLLGHSGDVSARSCQISDEPGTHGVERADHYDRNRRRRTLGGGSDWIAAGDDDVRV